MCGACGSGGGVPSWEDRLEPPSRRALLSRVAVSNRLLGHGLQVRSWRSGYLLSNGRGRSAHAADLDQLWRTCRQWGADVCGWSASSSSSVEEVPLDPGVSRDLNLIAVWSAAVAHSRALPGPLRLVVPDRSLDRTLQVDVTEATVGVQVRHSLQLPAAVRGAGARIAAEHLLAVGLPPD